MTRARSPYEPSKLPKLVKPVPRSGVKTSNVNQRIGHNTYTGAYSTNSIPLDDYEPFEEGTLISSDLHLGVYRVIAYKKYSRTYMAECVIDIGFEIGVSDSSSVGAVSELYRNRTSECGVLTLCKLRQRLDEFINLQVNSND